MHLPLLIRDLALILMTAGLTSIVFQRLRQPVVLGYIVAGLILGRHVPFFPSIVDSENIHVWGEIGVTILLFVLGLEFSFERLFRMGAAPFVTATSEIAWMLALGYALGGILQWPFLDRVFLGGILSISSTTIILKAFEERAVKGKKFVELVFGTLVVEDLLAIILLVGLSALAVQREFDGSALALPAAKLGVFIALWLTLSLKIAPKILRRISSKIGDEALLLASLGSCFGMVVLSSQLGVSPAMGAFAMGSILAESHVGERTMHLIEPLKRLFAAVFFVTVGLLMDPASLWEHRVAILIVTLVTVIGKSSATAVGAILSGQSLKTSIQAGLSMAQIGEFSFIIASLGLSLGVIGESLYPIAVGVAVLTTFLTPYLIRASESIDARVQRALPQRAHRMLAAHQALMERFGLRIGFSKFLREVVAKASMKVAIAPWDAHVAKLTVSPDSELVGRTLAHARVREIFGVTVAMLERGGRGVAAPQAFEVLFPHDRLHVIGTDAQIEEFRAVIEKPSEVPAHDAAPMVLSPWSVPGAFVGRSIRDSGIREQSDALVIGIERGQERILNPDAATVLRADDVLWLFGDPDRIARLA